MTRRFLGYGTSIIVLFLMIGCTAQEEQVSTTDMDFPVLSGEYIGQEPPGMEAVLFAPGIMSTGLSELNSVFFPGGKEAIYSVSVEPMRWALIMMREENGRWMEPEVAPFSGEYGDVDAFVSFDGNRIYFCSNRPRSGSGEPEADYDIWYVDRTQDGWSEAVNMGAPINSDAHEFYPSLTTDGTFYFQSGREGGIGGSDIYRAELVDGTYVEAECLPEPINSPDFESDAFIAPDESYLIVSTRREGDNIGQSDLYISFRAEDGSWSPLRNMGENINSVRSENCLILSPCGRYLFFTSRRYSDRPSDSPLTYESILTARYGPQNGFGDIYWVDARIIEQFRPE